MQGLGGMKVWGLRWRYSGWLLLTVDFISMLTMAVASRHVCHCCQLDFVSVVLDGFPAHFYL